MKTCIENSLHPVDSAIFFAFPTKYSDIGFELFRGHFGAGRVNCRFASAGGDLLGIACWGQENSAAARKFPGVGMLGLYQLAPPKPARVNLDIVQNGALATS